MLTIASPNIDRSLLTVPELRAAAKVADGSRDTELRLLGSYVDATITKACNISSDGVIPPTLRLEGAVDTFGSSGNRNCHRNPIILSRRPVVSIVSVTGNDVLLETADYELDAAAGLLSWTYVSSIPMWPYDTLSISYTAGYAIVPDDLKFAAIKFVQSELQKGDRDPTLRSKTIEGVSSYTWWVDPTKDSVIPGEVMDILERGGFVNHVFA